MEESTKPSERSAEDDARTLIKAHEIRKDKGRFRAVKMHTREVMQIAHGKKGKRLTAAKVRSIAHGTVRKRGSKRGHYGRGGR